ncbi:MAG: phosphodiester glycosidase family protein [Candidatus Auribacterota bacterium]|nr:phosphodiester glycosidase family protein [Candidatus Auribacterota bacterium]
MGCIRTILVTVFCLFINVTAICEPVYSKSFLSDDIAVRKERIVAPNESVHVYIIKDVHCNYRVQKEIAYILRTLGLSDSIGFIGVEGASGEVSFDIFKDYPFPEQALQASDFFMKNADIMGSEYFAIDRFVTNNPIPVFGLEDIEMYETHKKHFVDAMDDNAHLVHLFDKMQDTIDKRIIESLPDTSRPVMELLYFCDLSRSEKLIEYLSKNFLNADSYPTLKNYLYLINLLKNMDTKPIVDEAVSATATLRSSSDNPEELNMLTRQYFNQDISAEEFCAEIYKIAQRLNLLDKIPSVKKYREVSVKLDAFDADLLQNEIDLWSSDTEEMLLNGYVSENIRRTRTLICLLKKMVSFSLRFDEYQLLTQLASGSAGDGDITGKFFDQLGGESAISSLLPDKTDFVSKFMQYSSYYEYAVMRDQIMAERFISLYENMDIDKQAVIVAGGFHSAGLSDYLAACGINHCIVIPKTDGSDDLNSRAYLDRLTHKKNEFDISLEKYLMGLQVWHHFAGQFPDRASRVAADLFRVKLIAFLTALAPERTDAFEQWLAKVADEHDIVVNSIAQNRDGIICALQRASEPASKFVFEIRIGEDSKTDFTYNDLYSDGLNALYIESDNPKKADVVDLLTSQFQKQAETAQLAVEEDIARYMFMLRLNNPRLFYAVIHDVSRQIGIMYPHTDAVSLKQRTDLILAMNLILDEVETVTSVFEQRIIALQEADRFILARRAVIESFFSIYGRTDESAIQLDLISKSAELYVAMLSGMGETDSDRLLNAYFAHLYSGLFRENFYGSLVTPAVSDRFVYRTVSIESASSLIISGQSLADRVLIGLRELSRNQIQQKAVYTAEQLISAANVSYEVGVNKADGQRFVRWIERFPHIQSIVDISDVYVDERIINNVIAQVLAENIRFTQPLMRAGGSIGMQFDSVAVQSLLEQTQLVANRADSPMPVSYYRAVLTARAGNYASAQIELDRFIDKVTEAIDGRSIFDDYNSVDLVGHIISLVYRDTWLTDQQRLRLNDIYEKLYSFQDGVSQIPSVDVGLMRASDISLVDRQRNYNATGRAVTISQGEFRLQVVSEEAGRQVDFSKYAYIPLPGYIQIQRPGRTVSQMAQQETGDNLLLVAINGSNADWGAPNGFIIQDGELITKPVPGMNQKEVKPLEGSYSVLAFYDARPAQVTSVAIKDNKLLNGTDIHIGIQGQAILRNGHIVPSSPKPELIGYAQGDEVGFGTVTQIRASFSAIGIKADGEIVLLTMVGELNIPAMANLLKLAGANDAILLGGSGDAQQVVYGTQPVQAQERWDKPLRAGTYAVRPVNMGLLFFSNRQIIDELQPPSIFRTIKAQEAVERSL